MLRHLLKLTWKRKTRNLLLSVEILLAFVVVFAIAACGVRYWQLYRMPLGFQYQDVWSVQLQMPDDGNVSLADGQPQRFLQVLQAMPQVEKAAFATFSPFMNATWTTTFNLPGSKKEISGAQLEVSDQYWNTLGMQLAQGRWPSEQDEGANALPVVITQSMADLLFAGKPALDQVFQINSSAVGAEGNRLKVVGVLQEYRNKGEFMVPYPYVLRRHSLVSGRQMLRHILVKVRPGTARGFESELQRQLKQVRNDWGYHIAPLADMRSAMFDEQLLPLKVLAVIAVFLLAMVFFGLFGVLWQNTTRRIPEIGLRRALGASAGGIYRQIVAEQVLLSTLAMLGGLALLLQLPLTGILGDALNWRVFAGATALSMGVIYLLSLLCSLYPGWRASRLQPAAALHYE